MLAETTTLLSVKYDPMGNRVYRDGTNTRKYIVDIASKLPIILCEFDVTDPNSSLKSYIYAGAQILAQYTLAPTRRSTRSSTMSMTASVVCG
jgi:hypothetical protein